MNIQEHAVESSYQLATSFVPAILLNQYIHQPERKTGDPLLEDHTTLLWIDICNFSPLCIRLMEDTASGVEKITGILNSHYNFVIELVTQFGGQPLFFAGDGLMSAWPGDKRSAEEAVKNAAACAFAILKSRFTRDDSNSVLSLHAIIAMGPWQLAELEGMEGKNLISFYGEVFSDLSDASKNKAPNQLLITNKALTYLDKDVKILSAEYNTSILAEAPVTQPREEKKAFSLSENALLKLQSYIPKTLSLPLKAEHLKWIAEIRPVTIVFVRLSNNSNRSAENLLQLQESVSLARPIVNKYDGLLNQVWMDEKESNMLICFGPPPSAHIDNPERSVRLGFEIHHLLKNAGIENSVGISSGMAYCGILGNDALRQYTVIGDVVNLSAHMAGIKKNEIFCDKPTYIDSNKSVNFRGQIRAAVKGRQEPVILFIPKNLLETQSEAVGIPISIGRENELAMLLNAFRESTRGNSSLIILEGDNGMGKSRLLEDFKTKLSSEKARIVSSVADFVTRNTPYVSLRTIVMALLGNNSNEYEKKLATLNDSFIERFGPRAALLNAVLNTSIPESDEIRALTSTQRVQATHDFLLSFIEEVSKQEPIVIIVDDARWMDEPTHKLIESVKEKVSNSLVILTFQITEGLPEVQRLKNQGAKNIVLEELPDKDLEALICARLGVTKISRDVAEVVLHIAKGNPFFCIELAGSLMDHELLLFENNSCSLVKDAVMKEFSLPETVRGAIRRRIDRLGQGSQLSLKVGSVVGKRFAEKIICNIYPISTERDAVPGFLHEVEQSGFLNETMVDNLNGYLFNNATTVEVAYEMTLAEQRRLLHRESALWYENNFAENLQPFFVRLANHWSEASEKDRAVYYYEQEAIRLFRLGFVKEALNVGLEGVKLLGQDIPADLDTIRAKIGENVGAINALMEGKTIEGLIDHKKMTDPNIEKVIKMLLSLSPFAHQCQQGELFALMSIICQRLTLEHGNGESAAEVYAMYAIIYKALTEDSEVAFTWSMLSLETDAMNGYTLQSRVIFIHCWFIALWKLPFSALIPLSYTGADAGFRTGDILFACFNLSLAVVLKSTCGKPLAEVIQTATDHYDRNNNAVLNAAFHLIHEEQVAKAFQGRTFTYTSLTDEKYDEETDIAMICETDLFNQIGYYLVSKLKLNAHFGNWDEAYVWGQKSFPLLPAFANQPGHVELEQFYTLTALYKAAEAISDEANEYANTALAGIERFNGWAALCPSNFAHKALLLEAIRQGFAGNYLKAELHFHEAAKKAGEEGFLQDRGLCYEHLVRMQFRQGNDHSGALALATEAYRQWGAEAKMRYLAEEFAISK